MGFKGYVSISSTNISCWIFPKLCYYFLMLFLQKKQFPCNRTNFADFSLSYSHDTLDYEWDPKVHKPNNNLFSQCSHSFPRSSLFLSKRRKNNNNKKVRNGFFCWQIVVYSIVWNSHAVRQWIPERKAPCQRVRKQPVMCKQRGKAAFHGGELSIAGLLHGCAGSGFPLGCARAVEMGMVSFWNEDGSSEDACKSKGAISEGRGCD